MVECETALGLIDALSMLSKWTTDKLYDDTLWLTGMDLWEVVLEGDCYSLDGSK